MKQYKDRISLIVTLICFIYGAGIGLIKHDYPVACFYLLILFSNNAFSREEK